MMKFRFLRNGKNKFPCLSSQLSTTKGTRSTQKACYTPISSTVQVQGEAGKFGHFTQGGVRVQQVRCLDQICVKMISQHFPSDLGETKLWELIKKGVFLTRLWLFVCQQTCHRSIGHQMAILYNSQRGSEDDHFAHRWNPFAGVEVCGAFLPQPKRVMCRQERCLRDKSTVVVFLTHL